MDANDTNHDPTNNDGSDPRGTLMAEIRLVMPHEEWMQVRDALAQVSDPGEGIKNLLTVLNEQERGAAKVLSGEVEEMRQDGRVRAGELVADAPRHAVAASDGPAQFLHDLIHNMIEDVGYGREWHERLDEQPPSNIAWSKQVGRELTDEIANRGGVPIERLIQLAARLQQALAYAQQRTRGVPERLESTEPSDRPQPRLLEDLLGDYHD